jgi:hypothetical protein
MHHVLKHYIHSGMRIDRCDPSRSRSRGGRVVAASHEENSSSASTRHSAGHSAGHGSRDRAGAGGGSG